MIDVETIYRLTELVGGIGGEIAEAEWSGHAISDLLSEIDMFDSTEVPAEASEVSAAAAIITAFARGAEAHGFPEKVEDLTDNMTALSALLADIAKKASEVETTAATRRQTVIEEFEIVLNQAKSSTETLSSNIGDSYDQFAEFHLLTTQNSVENLIIVIRDKHVASLSDEIEKAIAGFSDEASATVTTLTDIRADLVQQLGRVQESAANQLNAGLSTIASDAQQAIEQRALNALQIELANAAESIVVGQTLQIGFSTGPWLQTIVVAKAAMQMLP